MGIGEERSDIDALALGVIQLHRSPAQAGDEVATFRQNRLEVPHLARSRDRDQEHGLGRSASGWWLRPHGRRGQHQIGKPATDPEVVARMQPASPGLCRGRRPPNHPPATAPDRCPRHSRAGRCDLLPAACRPGYAPASLPSCATGLRPPYRKARRCPASPASAAASPAAIARRGPTSRPDGVRASALLIFRLRCKALNRRAVASRSTARAIAAMIAGHCGAGQEGC